MEKQQTIEAIKSVIKARWIYASIIFFQGLLIRLFFPEVPLASTPILSLILASSFFFNVGYEIYIRRPPEKMSESGLRIVKALQVAMDQIWVSAILFFSGTVGKMVVVAYFISFITGASLYKKKGMVLSALFCQFLFTLLVVLQYKGIMHSDILVKEVFSVPFAIGDRQWLAFVLISFYTYSSGGILFGGYLASLFRRREARLQSQRDELAEKTGVLNRQTQELSKTKDWLHEALTKSDKARLELNEVKNELEKTNRELIAKIEELEKFSKVTSGREIKMAELKGEIATLKSTVDDLRSQLGKSQ